MRLTWDNRILKIVENSQNFISIPYAIGDGKSNSNLNGQEKDRIYEFL